MRPQFLILSVALMSSIASAQQEDFLPPDRFGIPSNIKLYPQNDPKTTLETFSKLLDAKRYDYLAAHVIDPAIIDARVAARVQVVYDGINKDLQARREFQQRNIDRFERDQLLPVDPEQFRALVQQEAEKAAFKQVVQQIRDTLAEFPENVRMVRKILREGIVDDRGGTALVSPKEGSGVKVYLKRQNRRWFVENRQQDDPAPVTPPANPGM
jgi:hypothetical protein